MIKGFNGLIGCTPVSKNTVEAQVNKAFAVTKNKNELLKVRVVFGCNDGPQAGDVVYIMGDQVALTWATTVFEVDGNQIILIPLSAVKLVETNG